MIVSARTADGAALMPWFLAEARHNGRAEKATIVDSRPCTIQLGLVKDSSRR
jgi:hypothetical protein